MAKPLRKRISGTELEIYALAQRKLIPTWAKKIADDFDQSALGAFIVSFRNNHYYVIDGQHRLEALRILGKDMMAVDCLVYENLTKEDEAALFLKHNNTKIVRGIDKFKVRVTAKEPNAVAIQSICDSFGIRIVMNTNGSPKLTSSVAAMDKIYRGNVIKTRKSVDGDALLKEVFRVLLEAWGDEALALSSGVMLGLAAFLVRYSDEINPDRLVRVMSKYKGGASGLIRNAKALRDIRRTSDIAAHAGIFVDMYNVGLREKLEDWGR